MPHVLARGWAPVEADYSFKESAQSLPLHGWRPVERRFRDGHTERWGAAELTLLGHGLGKPVHAVCATTGYPSPAGTNHLLSDDQSTLAAGADRAVVRSAQLD